MSDSWPEQDAVDAWVEKHRINVDRKVLRELKDAVTQPRLEVQKELEDLKKSPTRWALQSLILSVIADPEEVTTSQTLFERLEYTFSDYNDMREAYWSLEKRGLIHCDEDSEVLSLPESDE